MKLLKIILIFTLVLATSLCVLVSCGDTENSGDPSANNPQQSSGYASPNKLLEAYFNAIKACDYNAIYNMLPKQIQNYAMKNYGTKEGVISFIEERITSKYADIINDPTCHITNKGTMNLYSNGGAGDSIQEISHYYSHEAGETITLQDYAYFSGMQLSSGASFSPTFIKVNGSWYIVSVTGSDSFFN